MGDYIGKIIKVELLNSHYYKGKVIEQDDNFLIMIDMCNKEVTINRSQISSMEVLS